MAIFFDIFPRKPQYIYGIRLAPEKVPTPMEVSNMISKIAILIALLTSNLALSQISKEEWVSLCKKATGERKRTCKTIREKFGIKKGIFHENWDTTYDELSRHRDLKLYHRQISDLSPLSGFDHFKVLCLQGNNISDIRPLEIGRAHV